MKKKITDAAKNKSKRRYGNKCVISLESSVIDGCHIYDAGSFGDLNYWLDQEGWLSLNIVPLIRRWHRHLDDVLKIPEKKIEFLRHMANAMPTSRKIKLWAQLFLLDVYVNRFRQQNDGQIKWKRRR